MPKDISGAGRSLLWMACRRVLRARGDCKNPRQQPSSDFCSRRRPTGAEERLWPPVHRSAHQRVSASLGSDTKHHFAALPSGKWPCRGVSQNHEALNKKKNTVNGDIDSDEYAKGLLELRNIPRADGRSPADIPYGHPLRSTVPVQHKHFAMTWQERADACDRRDEEQAQKATANYNATAHPLSSLRIGQHVSVQSHATGLWDRVGTIVTIGLRCTYLVKMPSGLVLWKNLRFLRPYRPLTPVTDQPRQITVSPPAGPDQPASTDAPAAPPPPPQQPTRKRRVRFRDEEELVPRRRGTRNRHPPPAF